MTPIPCQDKKKAYEESLKRWWSEYADRKNHEDDEYVANSLLYDRNHLPRTAPAPDCFGQVGSSDRKKIVQSTSFSLDTWVVQEFR
eukprot:jgi/Picre1/27675/NNA_000639.t1